MKPWTEAETAYLREHYVADGAHECAAALGRPFRSVASRASKLRLTRRRPWTDKDDAVLAVMWGVHPIAAIAMALGRSEQSVYWRAGEQDLGLGCPQGHEYLSNAAVRTGYALPSLKMILRWASVRIERATVNPTWSPRTNRYVRRVVEIADVDEAIAAWCATETIDHAAERLDISVPVLSRLMLEARAAKHPRAHAKPRAKKHWRVDSALCDELVTEHRRRETIGEAARRVGHDRRTLIQWLADAGIAYRAFARLEPNDVDRVVAERRADPKCKARRAA